MRMQIDNLSENLKEYIYNLGLSYEEMCFIVDSIIGSIENYENVIEYSNETNNNVDELSEKINDCLSNVGKINDDVDEIGSMIGDYLQIENANLVEYINSVFRQTDLKKQELVAALVAKGLGVTTDMSFEELVNSIGNIQTGLEPVGTAVASDVLKGKTFINSTGQLIIGSMPTYNYSTVLPSTTNTTYTAGYYTNFIVPGDSDLQPQNIVEGITIFGVKGTAKITPGGYSADVVESAYTIDANTVNNVNSNDEEFIHSCDIWDESHGGTSDAIFGFTFEYVSGTYDIKLIVYETINKVKNLRLERTISPGSRVTEYVYYTKISGSMSLYFTSTNTKYQTVKFYYSTASAQVCN